MMLSPSQSEDAAFVKLRIDIFFVAHARHFIDSAVHRQHQRSCGLAAIAALQHGRRHGKLGRTPATVPSRSAEADNLFLEDGKLDARITAKKIVSGPQPGISTAEDGYIDLGRSLEGRARTQVVA
jgi:hypothetical protein